MEAPERIYLSAVDLEEVGYLLSKSNDMDDIEYVRLDAFIEKAEKWFEMQNEGVDSDGNYKCDMTDFEDFKNYMKDESYIYLSEYD